LICVVRFRETVTPVMRSCLMSDEDMHFLLQSPCNKSGSEFQTVARMPNVPQRNRRKLSLRWLAEWRCCQLETGDWHAAVGEVPWSSVLKTPMNISLADTLIHQVLAHGSLRL